MYMNRSKKLGVKLGDVPMNGFFWNTLSKMPDPMTFTTGMGMTLEQANLDHCQYYRHVFHAIGDTRTASILDKVYADEIGHVKHSVQWHTHWNNHHPHLSVTPKTSELSTDSCASKKENALTILGVYKLVLRRTTSIRFDCLPIQKDARPMCIGLILMRSNMTRGVPSKAARQIEHDLTLLPLFIAKEDDIVFGVNIANNCTSEWLTELGFGLPQVITLKDIHTLNQRQIGHLIPWANGPDAVKQLGALGYKWNAHHKHIFKSHGAFSV